MMFTLDPLNSKDSRQSQQVALLHPRFHCRRNKSDHLSRPMHCHLSTALHGNRKSLSTFALLGINQCKFLHPNQTAHQYLFHQRLALALALALCLSEAPSGVLPLAQAFNLHIRLSAHPTIIVTNPLPHIARPLPCEQTDPVLSLLTT